MTKTKLPYTLTPNENKETVLITYDTGKRNWNDYRYDADYGAPICDYIEVSWNNAGGNARFQRFSYRLLRQPTDPLANWQGREQAERYVTAEALNAAELTVHKLLAHKETLRRKGRKTWQYALIAAKSKELGWPTMYTTDLTNHDAYNLVTVNPTVFLWTVRATGTWLFTSNQNSEWRVAITKQYEDAKYYVIAQDGMKQITAEQFGKYQFKEQ